MFTVIDGNFAGAGAKGIDGPIQACPHHDAIRKNLALSDAALYDAVIATNRVKNFATYEVAKVINPTNPGSAHALVVWVVDSADRIVITSGRPAGQRASLQTTVNSKFGGGRVIIQ